MGHLELKVNELLKVGVVGGGVVGQATARSYLEFVDEVRVYDIVNEKSTHSLTRVLECDVIFICLPTPQNELDLSCNLSYLRSFFGDHRGYRKNFVLRSTVPVGTTNQFYEEFELPNLVHSPEFLTARCATTDAQMPARNIIGLPRSAPLLTDKEYNNIGGQLRDLYKKRFPQVPTLVMRSDESELVKLAVNSFFATKVAFFNEVHCLAEQFDMLWSNVMKGILSDGRIAHSHTNVPGRDGFGFGGSCLPKDLANLIHCLEAAGVNPEITYAVHQRNIEDRKRKV